MHPLVKWLEEKRADERITMRQLAAKLGITRSGYSRLVSGERQPGHKLRIAVHRTFPDAPESLLFAPAAVETQRRAVASGRDEAGKLPGIVVPSHSASHEVHPFARFKMTQMYEVEGIGQRIRRLREAKGWSMNDLARESRLSPNYIWQIEMGDRPRPSGNTLVKLARALQTSADYLQSGITKDDRGAVSAPMKIECPLCSREIAIAESYDTQDYEGPTTCRECGSLLEVKLVKSKVQRCKIVREGPSKFIM